MEEVQLAEATEPKDVAGELVDVLHFTMVRAAKAGVNMDDAVAELDRRTQYITNFLELHTQQIRKPIP